VPSVEPALKDARQVREDAILTGRVSIVYTLGTHYLFLPFSALCMAAAMLHMPEDRWLAPFPLVLLLLAAIGASKLKRAYDARSPEDDPRV
jgi:hypothetical protein